MWINYFSLLVVIAVQGSTACSFGNDLTQLTSSTQTGLIVNTANPAQCPGNATTWNLCYYKSASTGGLQSSTVYLGVYRAATRYSSSYSLVSGSSFSYTIPQAVSNYSCSDFSIPQSQQFTIQVYDVIAACVPSSASGRRIVASTSGSPMIKSTGNMCGQLSSALPNNIFTSGYSSKSIALHVSLDVNECAVKNGGCSQMCVDTPTGYNCTCFTGYQLASDMINCTAYVTISPTSTSATEAYMTISPTSTSATEADQTSAAIAASVITVIVVIAVVITVVAILLLLYVRRSSQVTISGRVKSNAFDNALYDDNGATINAVTYDAKEVYEPLNDNECSEQKKFGQSYEVPNKVSTMYSSSGGIELMSTENIYGNDDEDPYCLPPSQEEELYGQLEQQNTLKIPRHEIETKSSLGHGQFGGVHIGKWRTPKWECEVAIKMLDPTKSHQDDKVKFLQEAAIMAQFKHPNVIQLYGIVTDGEPLMLVIELAHNKDLHTHLLTLRPDPGQMILSHIAQCLLTYSQQVALGMQYLSSKSFVHRDLAARNVLLTKTCICKIADFGLSRNLDEENYYFSHGGMVPVKWTAPEAISYKKYSTASDVWSFGCVLYEIWSLGFKPFEGISNADVVAKVDTGCRLPPPPGCPLLVYQTMIHCWSPNEHSRPSFRDIHLSLSQNQEHVLQIPEEAASTHPQAAVLGAPLEAGEKMYMELQKSYF